jgi:hypothetical protein
VKAEDIITGVVLMCSCASLWTCLWLDSKLWLHSQTQAFYILLWEVFFTYSTVIRVFYLDNFIIVYARDGLINHPFIGVGSPHDLLQNSAAVLRTDNYELVQYVAVTGTWHLWWVHHITSMPVFWRRSDFMSALAFDVHAVRHPVIRFRTNVMTWSLSSASRMWVDGTA